MTVGMDGLKALRNRCRCGPGSALTLVVLALASGTGAGAESYTIEAAVARALARNAQVGAVRTGVEEARGRRLQAGLPANPELETEFAPNTRGREFLLGVGVNQPIPMGPRRRLERSVAETSVAAAEADSRTAERHLALAVRTAAIHLLAVDAQLGLVERQIEAGRQRLAASAQAAARGEASSLDAQQLRLELGQLDLTLDRLRSERAAASGTLMPLLGLPPTERLQIRDTLEAPPPLDPPPAPALSATSSVPDLSAASRRIELAGREAELVRARRWEEPTIGLFGEFQRTEDAPLGLENDTWVGLRLRIPLPLWDRQRGRLDEAAAAIRRRELEAESLRRHLAAEAATAHQEMTLAAQRHSRLTTSLLPQAEALVEHVTAGHRDGQVPLGEVLRAREARLALEAALIESRRDFHLARVRHESAAGLTHP